MAQFDKETLELVKKLQGARISLLTNQPFYALLLMHMKFSLDKSCETSYTDGVRVAFNPDYLKELTDSELEFVLMHEVLHAALGHPFRVQADYDIEIFDKACDIVVNSNILYSFGMDKRKITTKKFGEAIHLTPGGEEGYKFALEEVYEQLLNTSGKKPKKSNHNTGNSTSNNDLKGDCEDSDDEEDNDEEDTSEDYCDENEDGKESNEAKSKGNANKKNNSKAETSDINSSSGQGGSDKRDLEALIASIKQRNSEILASAKLRDVNLKIELSNEAPDDTTIDDHSFWNGDDECGSQRDVWNVRLIESAEIIDSSKGGKSRGTMPLVAERVIDEIKNPILDWRTILNDFVQEEICDYSFAPPDKRMEDCPFFLPDFNEKDESVKDILFMIDTSGSMSKEAITECYSEIYGAITQFNGKLQGQLGFFDAVVVEPVPFEDEDEFKIIRPVGGGGTSFHIIFDYVEEKMSDNPPESIIILTDGYAPFPDEKDANNIPVLWIINNNDVNPPWGKVARLIHETKNQK